MHRLALRQQVPATSGWQPPLSLLLAGASPLTGGVLAGAHVDLASREPVFAISPCGAQPARQEEQPRQGPAQVPVRERHREPRTHGTVHKQTDGPHPASRDSEQCRGCQLIGISCL